MGWLKDMVLAMFLSLINTFDNSLNEAEGVLTTDLFTSGNYSNVSAIAMNVIKPICLLIITICFLIEFLKTSMKVDMLKWEHVLKVLAKFVISKVVIDIAPTVLSAIYYTTSEWISDSLGIITDSPSLSNTASGVLKTLFNSINNWQAIGLALTMLLLFLVIGLSGLIIKVMAYARMFELYVYIAISPLPSAFFPLDENGGSRITRSFFLSFAAVCLQGLMMIICMKVFDSIVGKTIADTVNTISTDTSASATVTAKISGITYNMFMGSIVLVMSIIKSGSWAKQILNAA